MNHQSVITIHAYVEYSIEQLEIDFPSLVKSNNSGEKRERGHDFGGHKPSVNPLSASIVST